MNLAENNDATETLSSGDDGEVLQVFADRIAEHILMARSGGKGSGSYQLSPLHVLSVLDCLVKT